MIFIDIDNVCIDFTGTLDRHFGIKLALDDFETFHWKNAPHCKECNCKHCEYGSGSSACGSCCKACKFPSPEELYAKAEPQPWYPHLLAEMVLGASPGLPAFITKDYPELKKKVLFPLQDCDCCESYRFIEAPDKTKHCGYRNDVLIDDCEANCEAWRAKGGLAFWFDLSKPDIYAEFVKWWRLWK